MGLLIKFWNKFKKLEDTRYLIFEFLQFGNTEQLVGKFDDAVAALDQSKFEKNFFLIIS